ncbi:MAG: HPr kinase/phosphatase C-terminal domain-containing protein [Erythrobacter sp.]
MSNARTTLVNASIVAIGGRALAIEGVPGSGKSSLALALIDRGACLIGDDGATLEQSGAQILANPPPNISGKLEIHGIGIIEMPVARATPLALILTLEARIERLPDSVPMRDILGVNIPCLSFSPGAIAPAVRAEWALSQHGLNVGQSQK